MFGIPGTRLTKSIIRLFRKTHAVGLIVFRPNFENAVLFKKLISGLEEALGRKLLIAVDHEGGRVIHLSEGVTIFPDSLALGQTKNISFAARQGAIEAKELRRLGFDMNLAPVLDVLATDYSPNIGIRSYGDSAGLVGRLGTARIRSMQALGLSACAKHFPGQGASPLDAHLGLPVLTTSRQEMKRVHLVPFQKAIRAGVDAIMTSHPVYPALDSSKVPATFSRKIVRDLLRGEMGFRGAILSDDLEMGALRNFGSLGECAVRAIRAGHDMVLMCHESRFALEAHQALVRAYKNHDLSLAELERSSARIHALIQKRSARFTPGPARPERGGEVLAQKIAKQALSSKKSPLERGALACLPAGRREQGGCVTSISHTPPLSGHPSGEGNILIFFPNLSRLSQKIFIEKELIGNARALSRWFRKLGLRHARLEKVPLNPSASDIISLKKKASASKASSIIFFCFDAHLYPGSKRLLHALEVIKNRLFVFFMRDPYDSALLHGKVPHVDLLGFRKCQILEGVKQLKQLGTVPEGDCPF